MTVIIPERTEIVVPTIPIIPNSALELMQLWGIEEEPDEGVTVWLEIIEKIAERQALIFPHWPPNAGETIRATNCPIEIPVTNKPKRGFFRSRSNWRVEGSALFSHREGGYCWAMNNGGTWDHGPYCLYPGDTLTVTGYTVRGI